MPSFLTPRHSPGIALCPTQHPKGARRETCSLKTLVALDEGFLVEGASCEPPPTPAAAHLLVLLTPSYTALESHSAIANHLIHVPPPSQMSPGVLSSPFSTPMPHSPQQAPRTLSPERRNQSLGYMASCQPTPSITTGLSVISLSVICDQITDKPSGLSSP